MQTGGSLVPWIHVLWTDENIAHVAENDVTPDEVDQVLAVPTFQSASDSSGLPLVIGFTMTGRRLVVVYLQVDDMTVWPVTAYEPGDEWQDMG